MRTLTSYGRFLLILIFFSAVSVANAAAKPGGRLIVIRVANFGWNLAANLKIDGQTVANIVQGRRYDHRIPAGRHVLTISGRAEYPIEPADLDHCKRAARRNLHLYRPVGFRSGLSPANDLVARGDGEIGTLRRII
jgi:hypothetical protein